MKHLLSLLPAVVLAALATQACGSESDPITPSPDGGNVNVPGNDAGTNPNPSTAPKLTLAASQTAVATEGKVTLTATLEGGTTTAVDFAEGTTPLTTDAAAPFAAELDFSFVNNGAHTYVARATVDGKPIESNTVTVNVNVPANGVFVHPTTGLDTNDGTQGAPFKTIAKARQTITAGQNIYLNPGQYDATNQTVPSTSLTQVAFVRGLGPGVKIVVPTGFAMGFAQGGGLRDVAFEGGQTGVVASAGTFTMSGVTFSGFDIPLDLRGTVNATIDAGPTPVTNPPANCFACVALVQDAATVKYKGGGLQNYAGDGPAFFVRGTSTLTADGVTVKNHVGTAFRVWDSSHLKLTNSTIDHAGRTTGQQVERAAIYAGPNNTASPLTTSVELENSSITASTGPGIGFIHYNIAFDHVLKLTSSHVDGNTGGGILTSDGNLNASAKFTITSTTSTLDRNAFGILAPRATIVLTGGSISSNTGRGIDFSSPTPVNSLTARGTTFDANGNDTISFAGSAASVLDLGSTATPGGLTFKGITAPAVGVGIVGVHAGTAVGNTWMPNQQGADATGKYTAAKTLTSTDVGRNAALGAGSTLVVY